MWQSLFHTSDIFLLKLFSKIICLFNLIDSLSKEMLLLCNFLSACPLEMNSTCGPSEKNFYEAIHGIQTLSFKYEEKTWCTFEPSPFEWPFRLITDCIHEEKGMLKFYCKVLNYQNFPISCLNRDFSDYKKKDLGPHQIFNL